MKRVLFSCLFLAACGGDAGVSQDNSGPTEVNGGEASGNNVTPDNNTTGGFVPEVEEFAVRTVASTDRFVFVPNSADDGTTVARVNALDLSVTPVPVGPRPTEVVAFVTAEGASIAVVLVEGSSAAAIIRADAPADDPADLVHLVAVPQEVNALIAAPDGRHVLAYIDPERPLPADSSVASLQSAALIRIGATAAEDAVFDLSLTRLVRDVEFVAGGAELYVVGREGVNRLVLDDVASDTFVPPLQLSLSDDVFPPTDLEVEVAADGSFFALRSSAFPGVSLHTVDGGVVGPPTVVELPGIPTDIDLFVSGGDRLVLAAVRDAAELVLIDVDDALASGSYVPESITVDGASAGLAQLTPDLGTALIYSTLPMLPTFGAFSFGDRSVRTYPLRNAIRSVAVATDSATAIVVHDLRPDDASTLFQMNHGLTIVDIATGYRRPITLEADPIDLVMTSADSETAHIFALLESDSGKHGVLRVDLRSFRTDFISLARPPRQIGRVAGKVFVAQEATEGRITFVDVDTLVQRTLSGYELNAGID